MYMYVHAHANWYVNENDYEIIIAIHGIIGYTCKIHACGFRFLLVNK